MRIVDGFEHPFQLQPGMIYLHRSPVYAGAVCILAQSANSQSAGYIENLTEVVDFMSSVLAKTSFVREM